MSCDQELANEKTRCSGKNASYITNHLMTGPLENCEFCFPRISMFPSTSSRETLRFSGNKIHCSTRDQSLSVNICSTSTKNNSSQQQCLFTFNPNYFHSTEIIIQHQQKIISFNNKVLDIQNIVIEQNSPSLPR